MEISQLLSGEKKLEVDVGDGQKMTFGYHPSRYTVGFRMQLYEISFEDLVDKLINGIVSSWDLTKDGEPVPLTVGSFRNLPTVVFLRMVEAMRLDSTDQKN